MDKFSNVPLWVLLAAVLLYWLGWSYLYGYYSSFGLSQNELGLDPVTSMAFGGVVLQRWHADVVIISVILVIAAVVWTLSRVLSRNPQGEAEAHKAVSSGWRSWEGGKARYIAVGLVMMTAGSVLAMLFLSDASSSAVRVGRLDAARDMKEETTTLPLAHLVPDSTKSNRLSEGSLFDPSKREYHLLVHGTSGYYLFRTLKTVPGIPMGNLSLIFVPDTEVAGGEFNPRVPKEVQP